MHKSIQKNYNKLIADYDKLLQTVNALPAEIIYQPMQENKWSVVQTLQHLNFAFVSSINYLKKKLQGDTFEYNPIAGWVRSYLLNSQLRTTKKFKAPKGLPEPIEITTIETVINEWNTIQSELKQILEELPENLVNKNIFRHPRVGLINASQMITFFSAHLYHHEQQIQQYLSEKKG